MSKKKFDISQYRTREEIVAALEDRLKDEKAEIIKRAYENVEDEPVGAFTQPCEMDIWRDDDDEEPMDSGSSPS